MPSEFDLIRRYFTRPVRQTVLGVGDDCALVKVGEGMELAISVDMLVSGRHFFADADPRKLGHKTLAVNLSDMAAMGGTPRWATLAAALPDADEAWIAAFAEGFFGCADAYGVDVIGGDTTRGPLCLCVQIMGEVPAGQALKRSGAQAGDDVWVSGRLGDAALALAHCQQRLTLAADEAKSCLARLDTPTPRVTLGQRLRGIAHSAIDISDGLLADLGHILECSRMGAELSFAALPASAALRQRLDLPVARECLLAGGDDYELCFTAPTVQRQSIEAIGHQLDLPVTRIGRILAEPGLRVLDAAGEPMPALPTGFDHFARD